VEEGFDERKDQENKYIKKKEKCYAFPFFLGAPCIASIFDGVSPLWGLSVANH